MKTKLLLFNAFLLIFNCTNESVTQPEGQACDNGTFVGDVILTTQQEVEDFGAMCYTKIDGKLYIGKGTNEDSDIHDLSYLNNLTEVYNSNPDRNQLSEIWVVKNPNLTNLEGLHNITKTAGVIISRNDRLASLSGLEGLTQIHYHPGFSAIVILNNDALESLDGLHNIVSIGSPDFTVFDYIGISIQGNDLLTNLEALSNINDIYGSVFIGTHEDDVYYEGNAALTDFCGLTNLFSNGGSDLVLIDNNAFNPTVQDIIDGNCSQ
ncbi:MAG: hypothetical protein R2816_12620 [Flavobacteriaceae bacterium]|nr:hypothetical protein [Flavobacteriaceae bacterium]